MGLIKVLGKLTVIAVPIARHGILISLRFSNISLLLILTLSTMTFYYLGNGIFASSPIHN